MADRDLQYAAPRSAQSSPPAEDELLTASLAALIAGRSVRTIQRAYRAGALIAYRDGNGRGVRIRYGDLRQWMMAMSAAAPQRREEASQPSGPLKRLDMGGRAPTTGPSENLTLLNAARARLRRVDGPGGGASPRSGGPTGARPA